MTLPEYLASLKALSEKAIDDLETVLDCVPPEGLEFLWAQGTAALDVLDKQVPRLIALVEAQARVIEAQSEYLDRGSWFTSMQKIQEAESTLAALIEGLKI